MPLRIIRLIFFHEGFQIRQRRAQQLWVVTEETESAVALPAEKAADFLGLVTMVDAKCVRKFPSTDCASAALPLEDCIVFSFGNAIAQIEIVAAPGFQTTSGERRPVFRITGPAPAPVGAVVGKPARSIRRIAAVSVLVPTHVRRSVVSSCYLSLGKRSDCCAWRAPQPEAVEFCESRELAGRNRAPGFAALLRFARAALRPGHERDDREERHGARSRARRMPKRKGPPDKVAKQRRRSPKGGHPRMNAMLGAPDCAIQPWSAPRPPIPCADQRRPARNLPLRAGQLLRDMFWSAVAPGSATATPPRLAFVLAG